MRKDRLMNVDESSYKWRNRRKSKLSPSYSSVRALLKIDDFAAAVESGEVDLDDTTTKNTVRY